MKFSELSLRDYLAIEAFPRFLGRICDKDAAWRAFGAADAMLAQMGKRDLEMDVLKERAEKAERTLEVIRPVWAQGHTSDSQAAQASSNALAEIWALLQVDNQTAAVEELQKLIESSPQ